MPITFVSDYSIENYAEAKESEHSVTHEQDTCAPITFINDTMINLVQQKDNTDEECLEKKASNELI